LRRTKPGRPRQRVGRGPKVEAEIAFVIGRDLDGDKLTIADILRAVEFALPAIEIVDSRIADWKIGILDTIADNASSGLYVLGASPKKLDGLDLRLAGMVMERAGDTVLSGALGPMVAVNLGCVYEARINGLGSVRAAFAKETA